MVIATIVFILAGDMGIELLVFRPAERWALPTWCLTATTPEPPAGGS
ncbi:MAG: hypothetical protein ACRDST_00440 [Pseudonocardiaceae bacterium]